MHRTALLGALALVCLHSSDLRAERCSVQSTAHRVPVLELYTSEGCNSCPPADQWFSSLPRRGITADRAVQLAFHVDYWNELGWVDRFSQHAFSARQREIAARSSKGVVYTPQVVLDGLDLRQHQDHAGVERTVKALNRDPGRASIAADVVNMGKAVRVTGEVQVDAAYVRRAPEAWIAVFEQGLSSRVTRGENASKLLNHDFVVRALAGPFPIGNVGRSGIDQTIALQSDWIASRLGLAIFVQQKDDGRTLQAVSSYPICASSP